ncbi:hypothetical protein A3K63_02010 [Candidatus Micrarchaeota archaeon RBG_16_49_10]|nr:MAG: hypothetical protein A3K63_02010 [Candidatus Micrarchaeota archaeon RBG_16_49_10]
MLNFTFFIVFMLFYSRIMVTQIMFKLEKSTVMMEGMANGAQKMVLKTLKKKPDEKTSKTIRRFMEMFVIPPVDLDPYGIVKKFEHLMDLEKDRFKYFVNQVSPEMNEEEKANLMMGFSGAIALYTLAKILRHYVELIKKTKSYNLALIIQMELPLIERYAKAYYSGTEALANGWAIGDSIGPYVAASFIGSDKIQVADEETVICRKTHKGRDFIVLKAKGPGGRTGNEGRVLDALAKKEKIAAIITMDAAAKLEGEKTGSVAEGIGIAMGGIGVERSYIENVAVSRKLPMDNIIVKMGAEEAIMPMRSEIIDAAPKVFELLDEIIERQPKGGKIVLIGVGNT